MGSILLDNVYYGFQAENSCSLWYRHGNNFLIENADSNIHVSRHFSQIPSLNWRMISYMANYSHPKEMV